MRGSERYAEEGMMVEVNGVINLEDGMGREVRIAYEGGRTAGFVFDDKTGWEKDELESG